MQAATQPTALPLPTIVQLAFKCKRGYNLYLAGSVIRTHVYDLYLKCGLILTFWFQLVNGDWDIWTRRSGNEMIMLSLLSLLLAAVHAEPQLIGHRGIINLRDGQVVAIHNNKTFKIVLSKECF